MDEDEDFLFGVATVFLVVAVVVLVYCLFLLAHHRALSRCRPSCRLMEPGMVWLNLIPLFNIVWQFITVAKVSASLTNEFRARGRHRDGDDYGQTLGTVSCALFLAVLVPVLGILCAIGGFVCWVIYWGRIAEYGARLRLTSAGDYRPDEYEDAEDDEDDFDIPPEGERRPRRDRDPR